jgi:hypothetical protein
LHFGKVPAINFHTHPSDEIERLALIGYKILLPKEDEKLLERKAMRMRMSAAFPSSDDIVGMLVAQKSGASKLLMTSDSTILLVRTKPHVPIQEVTKLVTGPYLGKKYEQVVSERHVELFNRRKLTQEELLEPGIPDDIQREYRQIHLRALAEIGKKAGFICYFNFNPENQDLSIATDYLELK